MTRKQRRAAAAPAFTPELAFAEGLTPDDFAELQAMYARVHGSSVGATPASPEPAPPARERADEPAVLRLPKAQEVLAQGTACTAGALEAPVLQHLSEAKTQKEPERKARRLEYQQNRLAAAGEIVLNQSQQSCSELPAIRQQS